MSALATPSPPMSLMDVDGVLDGVLVSGPSAVKAVARTIASFKIARIGAA